MFYERKNKKKYQTLSSEIVHANPFYKVKKDEVVFPNGERGEYFIVKTKSTAFVVPVNDHKIIFIKQYRYVFDDWFLELPGGGIKTDESGLETAIKELQEEAGYKTNDIKEVGNFVTVSGWLDEYTHVFVARDLEFVGQELESSEDGMEVVEIEISKAYAMAENGEIKDGQTLAALMLAKKYIYKG